MNGMHRWAYCYDGIQIAFIYFKDGKPFEVDFYGCYESTSIEQASKSVSWGDWIPWDIKNMNFEGDFNKCLPPSP